jgi:hypothetical protein
MGFSKEDLGGGKHWGRVVNQGWGILASCIGIWNPVVKMGHINHAALNLCLFHAQAIFVVKKIGIWTKIEVNL